MTKAKLIPQFKCKNCGYEWVPRTPDPKVCPKCKCHGWKKSRWQKDERRKHAKRGIELGVGNRVAE